jgi:elongation factor G
MRIYKTAEIRNVAVVGHGASGKTSLVDALAFVAGTSKRHGSVKDGTALTDYTADEIERKYSINLAIAVAEWMDTKINLIDTPGYLDFTGDALAGVWAADGAVIVVSATAGVEVGTEKVWDYCEQRRVPRLFFVSLMDKEHADFEKVFQSIKNRLTAKVIPVEIPVGEGPAFHGIINLFSKKCHLYKKGTKTGEYEEVDVPVEYQERFTKYSQELIESIAATDDALLERYLGGEEIGRDEAIAAMKAGMAKGELYPLFCGAAELTFGTRALLSKMVELLPSPAERPETKAETWGKVEQLELQPVDTGPFVAQVFKTISEPHVGDVTFFRIYSGAVKNGQDVFNAPRQASEKLNHLCVAVGKERTEVGELHAGDIGVVAKLRDTHTNDTLSTQARPIVLPKIPFPEPVITVSVEVKQRGEEDKLSTGLHKLHEEDPTFHHEYNAEPDADPWTGGAPPRDRGGTPRAEVRRARGDRETEDRLSRDAARQGRGSGEAQEADRRSRPVRRLLDSHRPAAARVGIRVRRPDRGRGDPAAVHSGRREGDRRSEAAWTRRRVPCGRLQGGAVRRLVPRCRFKRNVLQNGRHPGVPERQPELQTRAARADHGSRGLDSRRLSGVGDG